MLCAVTVGINLTVSDAELRELGLTPGGYTRVSEDRMEELRRALEYNRGTLSDPRSGGSVANTADLIARAGLSCGMMGVGGNDTFGKAFVSNCEKASQNIILAWQQNAPRCRQALFRLRVFPAPKRKS